MKILTKDGPTSLDGYLVGHSDGYWHFFVERESSLLSIPDERVAEARTIGKAETSPTVEAAPTKSTESEEGMKSDEEKIKEPPPRAG